MRKILDLITKKLFLVTAMMIFCFTASASTSPIEMMAQAKVYAIPLIFVWEYLVGKSKFKSNSTIELIENFVKQVLGISKDDLKI